jgi:hypothetical protein
MEGIREKAASTQKEKLDGLRFTYAAT